MSKSIKANADDMPKHRNMVLMGMLLGKRAIPKKFRHRNDRRPNDKRRSWENDVDVNG
jgi:hypothetical protein